jgi:hypothetical protein
MQVILEVEDADCSGALGNCTIWSRGISAREPTEGTGLKEMGLGGCVEMPRLFVELLGLLVESPNELGKELRGLPAECPNEGDCDRNPCRGWGED